jgi:aspartokinase
LFLSACALKQWRVPPASPTTSAPVVTGFVGSTPSGETTLLGCGASDLTAAILVWALDAERVEILNLRIPRRLQRVRT